MFLSLTLQALQSAHSFPTGSKDLLALLSSHRPESSTKPEFGFLLQSKIPAVGKEVAVKLETGTPRRNVDCIPPWQSVEVRVRDIRASNESSSHTDSHVSLLFQHL